LQLGDIERARAAEAVGMAATYGDAIHTRARADAPYLFADLTDTSETDEQAAIDAGQIRAIGIRYTATVA
jgi:hypothetical protein